MHDEIIADKSTLASVAALDNMKLEASVQEQRKLSQLLRGWTVEYSLPPDFKRQVWRRIEFEEAWMSWSCRASALMRNWIAAVFRHTSLAVAYVGILMVIGAGIGWTQARHETSLVNTQLSVRYLQIVDPFQLHR